MHASTIKKVGRLPAALCPAALALVLAVSADADVIYNFTSFDGPGNNAGGTTVNGLNNNGDAVGFSSDNPNTPTLLTNFIRNPNGTFTTLATFDPLAMANGINDSLTVVGGFSSGTAFVGTNGSFQTLPSVNGTTASQTAFGISDNGLIVGQFADNATATTPGYLRQNNGGYTILNPVVSAVVTNAQSVNNTGLVTGFYSTDGVHQHGFFYNAATGTYTLPPDPNISNLVLTQFLGINDDGTAVGYYQTNDGSQHGFLFNLNTQSYTFLDDPNAAHTGVSITQITGVNDSGEIDGFYVDAATGIQRGFIATAATPAVPEPATGGLLAASLGFLAFCRFRTRRAAAPAGSTK